jgi:hypothetical protein
LCPMPPRSFSAITRTMASLEDVRIVVELRR